jgi:uncharacterized OB-fold protein
LTAADAALKARPVPTPDTQTYWDGVRAGRLMMQRCLDCDKFYFYPRDVCPTCMSSNVEWEQLSGDGTLYAYVICHRPAPGFAAEAPYALALVQLAEGPRIMTNIVGVEICPENLHLDMPLSVVFETRPDGVALVQFTPRALAT